MDAKEFVIGLLFLLAGMFSVGIFVFFYLLYVNIQKMTDAATKLSKLVAPLADERTMHDMVEAVLAIRSYLPAIVKSMGGLGETMAIFTKVALTRQGEEPIAEHPPRVREKPGINIEYAKSQTEEEQAPEGSSYYKAPSDDEILTNEMREQLRRSGVAIPDEEEVPAPPAP